MLGSGGHTHVKMSKPVDIRTFGLVAPSTIEESNIVEAGALREMVNPKSLKGPMVRRSLQYQMI